MAKDKALELSIKIAGQVDKSLIQAIGQTQNQVSSLSRNLSKIGTAGLAAMGALGVGTVAAIVDCTNVAEEFEANMADVVKYVDGLADATGRISDLTSDATENSLNEMFAGNTYAENYDIAKQSILDLSTQIPYTAEELTKLAAAAGQSGYSLEELFSVDDNGNIQGFLKDVAMWGVAMDIDAEQAGDWAAKWEAAFGMTHSEVMDMADTINYLGANSATTAAEIAEVVNEAVSMGDMAGVDPKTTVAIADAMLAMGVNASQAGTSIKRMFTNLTKGYAAPKSIRDALGQLGLEATEVAKAMQEDGTQTILDILQGIKNLPGDEQLATISSLFGQWAVEGGGKLAENIDLLEWAIQAANDPSLYNGSMAREFVIKSGTAESMDLMTSNAWYKLREEIGEQFLPVKKDFSLLMIDIMNGLSDNMPQLEKITESMTSILSGAVMKLGEAFQNALPYIQSGLDYVANNGEKVARIIGGIAASFAAMKAAPLIESVIGGAGSFLFGTETTGGTTAGTGRSGGLIESVQNLFGSTKAKAGSTAEFALLGARLANSPLTDSATGSQAAAGAGGVLTGVSNSVLGAFFGLKNRKSLIGNGNLTDKTYVSRLMATAEQITEAKENGGVQGLVQSGIANSGVGRYVSSIGSSIENVKETSIGGAINEGVVQIGTVAKNGLVSAGARAAGLGRGALSAIGSGAGNILAPLIYSAPVQGIGNRIANSTLAAKAGGIASKAGGALQAAGGFAGSLLSVGTTAIAPVTSMFSGVLASALPVVGVVGSVIAVLGILYDKMDSVRGMVGNVFGERGLAVFDTFQGRVDSVISTVSGILDNGLADALSGVRERFTGLFDGKNAILAGGAFDGAVSIAQSVLGVFGQLVTFSTGTLKPIIEDIFGYVTGTVLPMVLEGFIGAAPTISTLVTNVGTSVMAVAQMIGTSIQAVLPIAESVITTVLTVASVAIPAALAGFNTLWSGITAVVLSIQQVFDGLVTFISGAFTGNWSQAWEGVKQIFSGAFDALVELCKTPVNAVIAVINGAISRINSLGVTIPEWVPVYGGKSFTPNIAEIPMLARGGFTSGPSIAGEAGTEAVISFQNNVRSQNIDTWAKAGQLLGVDSLYEAPESKLMDIDAGSTVTEGGNVTFAPQITIQGNADENVVDDMIDRLKAEFEKWYEERQRRQFRTAY